MSVTSAQLKIVNTLAAGKGGKKAQMSPQQAASAAQLAMLSQMYPTLTALQQLSWVNICKVSSIATQPKNAFVALNMVRWQCGDEPLLVCPDFPDVVVALPTVTLEASRIGGPTGPLTLTVHSDAYAGRVMVWASRSLSSGRQLRSIEDGEFKLICVLEGLIAGATPLASAFEGVYLLPSPGTSVAVKLVPIGPNGFKGVVRPLMERVGIAATPLSISPE